MTQTYDMNQYLHYGRQETPNNDDRASFQQSQGIVRFTKFNKTEMLIRYLERSFKQLDSERLYCFCKSHEKLC